MRRVFLAHRADAPSGFIVQALRFMDHWSGAVVTIGRDDFAATFKALGSWNAWMAHVVDDHDVFIVPSTLGDTRIGKATAGILSRALEAKKPVWRLWMGANGDSGWVSVLRVETVNDHDWKNGWRCAGVGA